MSDLKTYLGDGAYADFDGWNILVTTSDGICDTNTIVFEPEVVVAFLNFVKRIGLLVNGPVPP